MGTAAAKHADQVVVTSDNPRSEPPQAIIDQILPGLAQSDTVQVQVEVDRALAIRLALAQARIDDVVLVAGKGHEDYQETAGVKRPFSDQAQVRLALKSWSGSGHVAQQGPV